MPDLTQSYPYAVGKRKADTCEPVLSNERLKEIKQSVEKFLPQSVNTKGADMDDYKELVEDLRSLVGNGEISYLSLGATFCERAADVIEQLVKERDELYMEVMDCTKKIGCKAIEQVKKERDAAIKDLHGYCWCCTKVKQSCFPTNNEDCKNWEWRGV